MASQTVGVRIEGLDDMRRAMEKAGVDVEELKDVMARVADEAAAEVKKHVPVGPTGKLRDSVRGNRAKAKAVVTIGSARVRYAAPINYGWPRRNIRAREFVQRADESMDTRLVEALEKGWAEIAERNGLA